MNLRSQEEIIKSWQGSIAEPSVSIICLAYNYERFLPQAIEGVLMQETNFPFELLIGVNPGSDNTPEVARRYAQKYPLIVKAVIREENIGAHKNFKDILSRAKGKYIAHCDADDYWTDPAKLQKQYEILESNKSCAITFHEAEVHDPAYRQNYYFVNENNRKVYTIQNLCYKNFIPAPSIFYRNYSFDLPDEIEEIQASDWAYFILLAEKGDIYYLPDCMAVYRKHSSGAWSSMDRQLMAIKSVESMIQIDELTHGKYSQWISRGIAMALYGVDQATLEKYRDRIKAKTYEICRYIITNKTVLEKYLDKINPKTYEICRYIITNKIILAKYLDKIKVKTYEICKYINIISNKNGVTDYRNYKKQEKQQVNRMEISESNTFKKPEG